MAKVAVFTREVSNKGVWFCPNPEVLGSADYGLLSDMIFTSGRTSIGCRWRCGSGEGVECYFLLFGLIPAQDLARYHGRSDSVVLPSSTVINGDDILLGRHWRAEHCGPLGSPGLQHADALSMIDASLRRRLVAESSFVLLAASSVHELPSTRENRSAPGKFSHHFSCQ